MYGDEDKTGTEKENEPEQAEHPESLKYILETEKHIHGQNSAFFQTEKVSVLCRLADTARTEGLHRAYAVESSEDNKTGNQYHQGDGRGRGKGNEVLQNSFGGTAHVEKHVGEKQGVYKEGK